MGAGKKYGQKKFRGLRPRNFGLKNFLEYFLQQSKKFEVKNLFRI